MVFVRPTEGQIDDLIGEINSRTEKTAHPYYHSYQENGRGPDGVSEKCWHKGKYMHHDINSIERMRLSGTCVWEFDVLVGINLSGRSGLARGIPGGDTGRGQGRLLRSETSLIQTIGELPEMLGALLSCMPTPLRRP